jgi:hypothetical protein
VSNPHRRTEEAAWAPESRPSAGLVVEAVPERPELGVRSRSFWRV